MHYYPDVALARWLVSGELSSETLEPAGEGGVVAAFCLLDQQGSSQLINVKRRAHTQNLKNETETLNGEGVIGVIDERTARKKRNLGSSIWCRCSATQEGRRAKVTGLGIFAHAVPPREARFMNFFGFFAGLGASSADWGCFDTSPRFL